MNILLVGMFDYRNLGLRIMHAMLEQEEGVEVSTAAARMRGSLDKPR